MTHLLFVMLTCMSFASDWPQWRGPTDNGIALKASPPTAWSETENILWKVPLPGSGISTPIVWGEHIYLTTAIPIKGMTIDPERRKQILEAMPEWMRNSGAKLPDVGQAFTLMCHNLKDGTLAWEKTLHRHVPHEGLHADSTWASGSPATDGKVIIAYFGSNGIYALDMKGNLLWEKDLGDMRTRAGFGEGSSPYLYKGKVIVNWDHEDQSFITVLDAMSGKELWRKNRDEITSWSTPTVAKVGDMEQVIVAATNRTRAYDLKDGSEIWESEGMTVNTIPSPVYHDGKLIVMSGFRGNALQAIDLKNAKGKVNGTPAMLWEKDRDTPYVPSPCLSGERLYFLKHNKGILSCLDVNTGEHRFGPVRLEDIDSNIYASPVAAGGHIYITGRQGTTLVIKDGDSFEKVAVNQLDDRFDASAVVVGNSILLRGHKNLYRIQ